MPKVILKRRPGIHLPELEAALPEVVARCLSSGDPDGTITPEMVRVEDEIMGSNDSPYEFEIDILAYEYPKRKANLKARTEQIVEALRSKAGSKRGFARVRLQPTALVEF